MTKEKDRSAKSVKKLRELESRLVSVLASLHEVEKRANGTYYDSLTGQELWAAHNLVESASRQYKAICDAISTRLEFTLNARAIDDCRPDE